MMHFRNTSDRRRKLASTATCQPRAKQNRAAAEHCEAGQDLTDLTPVLASQIAMAFWCQPNVRATAVQQRANRATSITRRGTTMHATAEQIVTSLALALAAAAAILTSPHLPNRMNQISQWLAEGTAAEAAASAGAIGENPDRLNLP
jgi:hypothetical protein